MEVVCRGQQKGGYAERRLAILLVLAAGASDDRLWIKMRQTLDQNEVVDPGRV